MRSACPLTVLFLISLAASSQAADWVGFRGPGSSGFSDEKGLPTTWSATENVVWKTELPGAGASSPIVTGDKVLVTCYRGAERGSVANLQRVLVCADRASGKILWTKEVNASDSERPYQDPNPSHGYASSTPVTDGERVFVQFGKSGVIAFNLEGEQLWQAGIGNGSDRMGWGAAASPVLYKNLVIVNAGNESSALIALDKETGKEAWKAPSENLNGCWGTPVLVDVGDGRQEVVISVPNEIWGLNPDSGLLRWYCEGVRSNTICPTVVAKDGIVYAIGGGGGGQQAAAIAVRAGGKGDVTDSHILWRKNVGSYVTSPVIVGEHLYWMNNQNMAICLKLADGESMYQQRLESVGGGGSGGRPGAGAGEPKAGGDRAKGGRGFGSGFGGRGMGGMVNQPYASVVAADGKIFGFSRQGTCYVLAAEPKFEILAQNRLDDDAGTFNATPAIDDGQLIVRSDKYLYCLGTK